jgi:hypothetical protein
VTVGSTTMGVSVGMAGGVSVGSTTTGVSVGMAGGVVGFASGVDGGDAVIPGRLQAEARSISTTAANSRM